MPDRSAVRRGGSGCALISIQEPLDAIPRESRSRVRLPRDDAAALSYPPAVAVRGRNGTLGRGADLRARLGSGRGAAGGPARGGDPDAAPVGVPGARADVPRRLGR